MPSKTPVPYWSPCARTCTFASPQGTSLPLNQICSVGVNPMKVLRTEYISRRPFGTDIPHDVSEYRIEKRRTEAVLTLSTGAVARGCFFLAGSRANRSGPE